MLALQAYVPEGALTQVESLLSAHDGVQHVVRLGLASHSALTLLSADVDVGVLDVLLPAIIDCGVSGDEIIVVHQETSRPLGASRTGDIPSWAGSGGLAWTELAMASRQYARAVPQYLIFMSCAGVIAALGVLTRNTILIVGAMAISPDLLPLCAACVSIADRRPRLAVRAFAALVIGLTAAGVAALVITAILRAGGYGPANSPLGDGGLGGLPTVNASTVIVAFFAGIAGILAFETRSSAAVGVAISITTIPAAAYMGSAIAEHEAHAALGALAVLAVNISMLLLAGTLTLLLQRFRRRRGR